MEIEYQKSTIKLADVIGTSHISNKVKNHNKISLLFSNQLTKLKKRVSSNLDNNNSKDAKFKIKNMQTKESHNNNIIFRKIKNTTKTSSKNNFNNKTRNKINTQFCSNKTSILNEKDTINSSNINYTNDPLFGATNNLTSNVDNNILTISLQKHSYKNSKKFIDKQKNYSLINTTNKNNYKNKYAPNLSSNLDDDQFINKNNKTINNSNIFCLNINKQMKDKKNYFTSISSNKSSRIRKLIKNSIINQSNSIKNYKIKDTKQKINDISKKNNKTIIFNNILKKKLSKNIIFRKKENQQLSEKKFFTNNNSINPLINHTNFGKKKENIKDNQRYNNNLTTNSSYFIKKQNKSGNKIISINKTKKLSPRDSNIVNSSLSDLINKKINCQKNSLIMYLKNVRSISKKECKQQNNLNNQKKYEKEKKNYSRVINIPFNLLKKRNSSLKRKSEERKKFFDSEIILKKNNNSTNKIRKKIRKIRQIKNDIISSNSKSNYITKNFINISSILNNEKSSALKLFQLKKSPIKKTHINYKYLKKIRSVEKCLLKKNRSKSPTLKKYQLNIKMPKISSIKKRCKTERLTYITKKSKIKMKKYNKEKTLSKNDKNTISFSYTDYKSNINYQYDNNPQNVAEYTDEILYILLIDEKNFFEKKNINPFYLTSKENEITPEIRAMLIDWVIEVHRVFNFKEKSLFVAVQLIDRYLSKNKIKLDEFQLIAITCINIASKHEEVIFPIIANYISVCGNKITAEDMMKTEIKILTEIEYEISKPTLYDFFEIFAYLIKMGQIEIDQGLYILNIILLDVNMLQYNSSVLAFCVIKIITNKNIEEIIIFLNEIYEKVSKNLGQNAEIIRDIMKNFLNEKNLEEIIESIKMLFRTVLRTHYINTRNKFALQKFHAVSTFCVI